MGLIMNTNVMALNAQRNLSIIIRRLGRALEKLSSGLRINRPVDDAAGLAVSEKMRTLIRGMRQATHDPDDAAAAPDAGGSASPAQATESRHFAQTAPFNEQWSFKDGARCPVSGTAFEHLRVRTGAVKSASRDSDFRIVYRTVDPGRYLVTVCTHCSYAAY